MRVDGWLPFVNTRRLIIIAYAVLLLGFGVASGAVLLDARAEYRRLRQIEASNRQKLAEAEARLREQEIILQRLKSDPEYVERAIRQRLKYAKPGEMIFRFPPE